MPLLSVNLLLLVVVFAEIVWLVLYKSLPPSTHLYRSLVDTPNQRRHCTCFDPLSRSKFSEVVIFLISFFHLILNKSEPENYTFL